jgi:23S rRNA (adenine2030-N6)-methyltransferase
MLSYQHEYHAGNFADVLKHWCLQLCTDSLNRKASPWTYYDTHAGDGEFSLREGKAAAAGEWSSGIKLLWDRRGNCPPALQTYLAAVSACNPDGEIRFYPGSPGIAAQSMRAQDKAVLCELHPQAFPVLRQVFAADPAVKIHQRDGFEGVMALLPPPSGRGLVLIDPSYELKADYQRIPDWVTKALQRWRQMTVLVWYPILEAGLHKGLLAALKSAGQPLTKTAAEWLQVELLRLPGRSPAPLKGLLGCGMFILNPPWQLDERLAEGIDWLAGTLHCKGMILKQPD